MVIGVVAVILLGLFYAATDGVFAALASAQLPVERRAAGLAAVSTANDVGRMFASILFGWLWSSGATADALRHFRDRADRGIVGGGSAVMADVAERTGMSGRVRVTLFWMFVVVCVGSAIGYVRWRIAAADRAADSSVTLS